MQSRKRACIPNPVCWLGIVVLLVPAMLFFIPARANAAMQVGPVLTWDNTMIYTGQNEGNPWGPPGEQALVHGQGFLPNQKINLALAKGNSDTNAAVCHSTTDVVAHATATATGTFEASFVWPLTVNLPGQQYSICALNGTTLISAKQEPGPFTVLTEQPPALTLSTASASPGGSVMVNGANWVPDQQVRVEIILSNTPGFITSMQTTSGNGLKGTFSVSLTLPAGTAAGSYQVTAMSIQNNLLSTAYTQTNQPLTVSIATPTPGVTPTATATPTPTVAPTATTTATPTETTTTPVTNAGTTSGNSNGGSTSGPNSELIFIILLILALLVLAIGGLLILMAAQHRKATANPVPAMPAQGYGALQHTGHTGAVQAGQPTSTGVCSRCGSPLPPNSPICRVCGLHNGLPYEPYDPDGPTVAF